MSALRATLFGKFNIERGELRVEGIHARKVQELLSYLLIFRNHAQPRESLAEVLWGEQSSANSRKYLRQTLWRLQSALKMNGKSSKSELLIETDWLQLNLPTDFWLDIAEFERVFNLVKGKRVQELNLADLKMLEYAAELYKGDLLEGWYQDWCIFERERFQTMHLMLLDKLVQFCEMHQMYETGLIYGMEILRHDHGYERTHRQLMRLYFMTGNRTQALHQYVRCASALRDELDVEPSERTKQLYDQIRSDNFRPPLFTKENIVSKTKVRTTPALQDILKRLQEASESLSRLEHKIQEDIVALGDAVSGQS